MSETKQKSPRLNSKAAAELRIAIAKDVLECIAAGQYHAKSGFYFDWMDGARVSLIEQDTLCKAENKCEVCGIGAAMASAYRLYNGGSIILHDIDRVSICAKLKTYFSFRQLALIETVFEPAHRRAIILERPVLAPKGEDLKRAESFRASFGTDFERLAGIYRNIVFNKGAFIP